VYTIEAAHNPEVAGSNPAPATAEGLETGPFALNRSLIALETLSKFCLDQQRGLRVEVLKIRTRRGMVVLDDQEAAGARTGRLVFATDRDGVSDKLEIAVRRAGTVVDVRLPQPSGQCPHLSSLSCHDPDSFAEKRHQPPARRRGIPIVARKSLAATAISTHPPVCVASRQQVLRHEDDSGAVRLARFEAPGPRFQVRRKLLPNFAVPGHAS
jgi:hypothetical protein